MKISSQSGMVPITPLVNKARVADRGNTNNTARGDQPEVSNTAQLLARNQSKLQDQLASREKFIQRFSGNISDSVKLHERTIDRIMQRMQNT